MFGSQGLLMGLGLRGLRFRTLASHFADALWAQFVKCSLFSGMVPVHYPETPKPRKAFWDTICRDEKQTPGPSGCLSCVLSVVLCVRSIVLLLLLQVGRGIVMHVVVPSIPDFKPIYTKPS